MNWLRNLVKKEPKQVPVVLASAEKEQVHHRAPSSLSQLSGDPDPVKAAIEARREKLNGLVKEYCSYERLDLSQKRLVVVVEMIHVLRANGELPLVKDAVLDFLREVTFRFVTSVRNDRGLLRPVHEILLALSPLRPLLPDSPYGLQLLFEIQQLVSDGERAGAVLKGQLVSVLVQFLLQPQVVDFEDLRSTLTTLEAAKAEPPPRPSRPTHRSRAPSGDENGFPLLPSVSAPAALNSVTPSGSPPQYLSALAEHAALHGAERLRTPPALIAGSPLHTRHLSTDSDLQLIEDLERSLMFLEGPALSREAHTRDPTSSPAGRAGPDGRTVAPYYARLPVEDREELLTLTKVVLAAVTDFLCHMATFEGTASELVRTNLLAPLFKAAWRAGDYALLEFHRQCLLRLLKALARHGHMGRVQHIEAYISKNRIISDCIQTVEACVRPAAGGGTGLFVVPPESHSSSTMVVTAVPAHRRGGSGSTGGSGTISPTAASAALAISPTSKGGTNRLLDMMKRNSSSTSVDASTAEAAAAFAVPTLPAAEIDPPFPELSPHAALCVLEIVKEMVEDSSRSFAALLLHTPKGRAGDGHARTPSKSKPSALAVLAPLGLLQDEFEEMNAYKLLVDTALWLQSVIRTQRANAAMNNSAGVLTPSTAFPTPSAGVSTSAPTSTNAALTGAASAVPETIVEDPGVGSSPSSGDAASVAAEQSTMVMKGSRASVAVSKREHSADTALAAVSAQNSGKRLSPSDTPEAAGTAPGTGKRDRSSARATGLAHRRKGSQQSVDSSPLSPSLLSPGSAGRGAGFWRPPVSSSMPLADSPLGVLPDEVELDPHAIGRSSTPGTPSVHGAGSASPTVIHRHMDVRVSRTAHYHRLQSVLEFQERSPEDCLTTLLGMVSDLCFIGTQSLPLPADRKTLYQDDSASSPGLENPELRVKNISAFNVLQSIFLKVDSDEHRLHVINRILMVFSAHADNFWLLQQLHPLAYFIEVMPDAGVNVQKAVLKLMDYVVTVINCIPVQELCTYSLLLQSRSVPVDSSASAAASATTPTATAGSPQHATGGGSSSVVSPANRRHNKRNSVVRTGVPYPPPITVQMILSSLRRFVSFEPVYSDILRDCGMLDLLVSHLAELVSYLLVVSRRLDSEEAARKPPIEQPALSQARALYDALGAHPTRTWPRSFSMAHAHLLAATGHVSSPDASQSPSSRPRITAGGGAFQFSPPPVTSPKADSGSTGGGSTHSPDRPQRVTRNQSGDLTGIVITDATQQVRRPSIWGKVQEQEVKHADAALSQPSLEPMLYHHTSYRVALRALSALIDVNQHNLRLFREAGGHHSLYALLRYDSRRLAALRLLQRHLDEENVSDLMELLQFSKDNVPLQVDVMRTLSRMLSHHRVKDYWRDMAGFECVFSLLARLGGSFHKGRPNIVSDLTPSQRQDVLAYNRHRQEFSQTIAQVQTDMLSPDPYSPTPQQQQQQQQQGTGTPANAVSASAAMTSGVFSVSIASSANYLPSPSLPSTNTATPMASTSGAASAAAIQRPQYTQWAVLESLFDVLRMAIQDYPLNRYYFWSQSAWKSLASALRLTGVLGTPVALRVTRALLELATESADVAVPITGLAARTGNPLRIQTSLSTDSLAAQARAGDDGGQGVGTGGAALQLSQGPAGPKVVRNPESVLALLSVMQYLPAKLQVRVLEQVLELCEASFDRNASAGLNNALNPALGMCLLRNKEALCTAGVLGYFLRQYGHLLVPPEYMPVVMRPSTAADRTAGSGSGGNAPQSPSSSSDLSESLPSTPLPNTTNASGSQAQGTGGGSTVSPTQLTADTALRARLHVLALALVESLGSHRIALPDLKALWEILPVIPVAPLVPPQVDSVPSATNDNTSSSTAAGMTASTSTSNLAGGAMTKSDSTFSFGSQSSGASDTSDRGKGPSAGEAGLRRLLRSLLRMAARPASAHFFEMDHSAKGWACIEVPSFAGSKHSVTLGTGFSISLWCNVRSTGLSTGRSHSAGEAAAAPAEASMPPVIRLVDWSAGEFTVCSAVLVGEHLFVACGRRSASGVRSALPFWQRTPAQSPVGATATSPTAALEALAVFAVPYRFVSGIWHHITMTFVRNSICVYANGALVFTHSMYSEKSVTKASASAASLKSYPSSSTTGVNLLQHASITLGSRDPSAASAGSTLNSPLGAQRSSSHGETAGSHAPNSAADPAEQILWWLGPFVLIDVALSPSQVAFVYQKGPAYVGLFDHSGYKSATGADRSNAEQAPDGVDRPFTAASSGGEPQFGRATAGTSAGVPSDCYISSNRVVLSLHANHTWRSTSLSLASVHPNGTTANYSDEVGAGNSVPVAAQMDAASVASLLYSQGDPRDPNQRRFRAEATFSGSPHAMAAAANSAINYPNAHSLNSPDAAAGLGRPSLADLNLASSSDATSVLRQICSLSGQTDPGFIAPNTARRDPDGPVLGVPAGYLDGGVYPVSTINIVDSLRMHGGLSALFSYLPRVETGPTLQLLLSLLTACLHQNPKNLREMARLQGYELLAQALKLRAYLLNADMLKVLLAMVEGTDPFVQLPVPSLIDYAENSGEPDATGPNSTTASVIQAIGARRWSATGSGTDPLGLPRSSSVGSIAPSDVPRQSSARVISGAPVAVLYHHGRDTNIDVELRWFRPRSSPSGLLASSLSLVQRRASSQTSSTSQVQSDSGGISSLREEASTATSAIQGGSSSMVSTPRTASLPESVSGGRAATDGGPSSSVPAQPLASTTQRAATLGDRVPSMIPEAVPRPLIANTLALKHLLLDFHVWRQVPASLQIALFSRMAELCETGPSMAEVDLGTAVVASPYVSGSPSPSWNVMRLKRSRAAADLLNMLSSADLTLGKDVLKPVLTVFRAVILQNFEPGDVEPLASFVATGLGSSKDGPMGSASTPGGGGGGYRSQTMSRKDFLSKLQSASRRTGCLLVAVPSGGAGVISERDLKEMREAPAISVQIAVSILDTLLQALVHAIAGTSGTPDMNERIIQSFCASLTPEWFSMFFWPDVHPLVVSSVMTLLATLVCGSTQFQSGFVAPDFESSASSLLMGGGPNVSPGEAAAKEARDKNKGGFGQLALQLPFCALTWELCTVLFGLLLGQTSRTLQHASVLPSFDVLLLAGDFSDGRFGDGQMQVVFPQCLHILFTMMQQRALALLQTQERAAIASASNKQRGALGGKNLLPGKSKMQSSGVADRINRARFQTIGRNLRGSSSNLSAAPSAVRISSDEVVGMSTGQAGISAGANAQDMPPMHQPTAVVVMEFLGVLVQHSAGFSDLLFKSGVVLSAGVASSPPLLTSLVETVFIIYSTYAGTGLLVQQSDSSGDSSTSAGDAALLMERSASAASGIDADGNDAPAPSAASSEGRSVVKAICEFLCTLLQDSVMVDTQDRCERKLLAVLDIVPLAVGSAWQGSGGTSQAATMARVQLMAFHSQLLSMLVDRLQDLLTKSVVFENPRVLPNIEVVCHAIVHRIEAGLLELHLSLEANAATLAYFAHSYVEHSHVSFVNRVDTFTTATYQQDEEAETEAEDPETSASDSKTDEDQSDAVLRPSVRRTVKDGTAVLKMFFFFLKALRVASRVQQAGGTTGAGLGGGAGAAGAGHSHGSAGASAAAGRASVAGTADASHMHRADSRAGLQRGSSIAAMQSSSSSHVTSPAGRSDSASTLPHAQEDACDAIRVHLYRLVLHIFGEYVDTKHNDLQRFVLEQLTAHDQLVFGSNNLRKRYIWAMCYHVYIFLTSRSAVMRTHATNLMKSLLSHQSTMLRDMLVYRSTKTLTILNAHDGDGFKTLLDGSSSFAKFTAWLAENISMVSDVFQHTAFKVWREMFQKHLSARSEHRKTFSAMYQRSVSVRAVDHAVEKQQREAMDVARRDITAVAQRSEMERLQRRKQEDLYHDDSVQRLLERLLSARERDRVLASVSFFSRCGLLRAPLIVSTPVTPGGLQSPTPSSSKHGPKLSGIAPSLRISVVDPYAGRNVPAPVAVPLNTPGGNAAAIMAAAAMAAGGSGVLAPAQPTSMQSMLTQFFTLHPQPQSSGAVLLSPIYMWNAYTLSALPPLHSYSCMFSLDWRVSRYKLDFVEGPSRQRKKMELHDEFSKLYQLDAGDMQSMDTTFCRLLISSGSTASRGAPLTPGGAVAAAGISIVASPSAAAVEAKVLDSVTGQSIQVSSRMLRAMSQPKGKAGFPGRKPSPSLTLRSNTLTDAGITVDGSASTVTSTQSDSVSSATALEPVVERASSDGVANASGAANAPSSITSPLAAAAMSGNDALAPTVVTLPPASLTTPSDPSVTAPTTMVSVIDPSVGLDDTRMAAGSVSAVGLPLKSALKKQRSSQVLDSSDAKTAGTDSVRASDPADSRDLEALAAIRRSADARKKGWMVMQRVMKARNKSSNVSSLIAKFEGVAPPEEDGDNSPVVDGDNDDTSGGPSATGGSSDEESSPRGTDGVKPSTPKAGAVGRTAGQVAGPTAAAASRHVRMSSGSKPAVHPAFAQRAGSEPPEAAAPVPPHGRKRSQAVATRRELLQNTSDDDAPDSPETGRDADGDMKGFGRIFRLMEPGDEVLDSGLYLCARIAGLDKHDGVAFLCERNMYIIDNFGINAEGELEELGAPDEPRKFTVHLHTSTNAEGLPEVSLEVRAIPKAERHRYPNSVDKKDQHQWQKLAYKQIREVHKRRYQLQSVGIEVFETNGSNFLLVFESQEDRDDVYDKITSRDLSDALLRTKSTETLSHVRSAEDAQARLFKRPLLPVTERWVNGEISNFAYLMFLNTLAGRSYNDLTQYPVFPWVLSDYTSETLDLNDPSVFRDLSKPMGALSPKRAQQFQQRFDSWEDPSGVIPKFHYGTHYSSAASVLYYLLRLEPFTRVALQLQGGKFDHADRLFHSLRHSWHSASSEGGLSDVKELIPEFFYLPDFLENQNHFDMGSTQRGKRVDDVELPPWANNDARTFVRLHRQALESEYVSNNLHHWIDLIFGFKQKGEEAEKAQNVYYYLTYEGTVDVHSIDDPMVKMATIAQINNFGQTPHQVFTKPHPARKKTTVAPPVTISSHTKLLRPTAETTLQDRVAAGEHGIVFYKDRLTALSGSKTLIPGRFNRYVAWGFPDYSVRVYTMGGFGNTTDRNSDEVHAVYESMHDGQVSHAFVTDDAQLLITGGEDAVVSVWKPHPTQRFRHVDLLANLCGHTQAITCIAASTAYALLVTGSSDCQLILWDLNRLVIAHRLPVHPAPVTAVAISHMSGDVVTCAGTCLYVWSVNGDLVAERKVAESAAESIESVGIARGPDFRDDNVIITGHRDGTVRFWRMAVPSKKSAVAAGSTVTITAADGKVQAPMASPPSGLRALSIEPYSPETGSGWSLASRWDRRRRPFMELLQVQRDQDTADDAGQFVPHGAPVTSIHTSDEMWKRLWTGDAAGAVVVWTLHNDEHFVKDSHVKVCTKCTRAFGVIERRHHCRFCGGVFCANCSSKKMPVLQFGHKDPVRVCDYCYEHLNALSNVKAKRK